jgi:hypothetical protein
MRHLSATSRWRTARLAVAAVLVLSAAGCLQIETVVKLHEDGSATITERVQFSKRLLDYGGKKGSDLNVAELLEKPRVLERMKHMGKDIQLVRHTVRDGEGGSRESVSVFRIPRIQDFRYVSPYFGRGDYAKKKALVCHLYPALSGTPGRMCVAFNAEKRGYVGHKYRNITPAERQAYRRLKPMFEDMLDGFQLKFVFESYAPVFVVANPYHVLQRNKGGRVFRAHLIDVSSENLGRYGQRFISVEEAMVELLQMQINGKEVLANCGFWGGGQLFRFGTNGIAIAFRPSKQLFDRYFKGKTLDFGRGGKRKADFKKDGYHGKSSTGDKDGKDTK